MAHLKPIITNVEDLTGKLRVTFTHDPSGDTLEGFNIYHDDENGEVVPTWIDAVDCTCVGGGDGGSPVTYQVLVDVPLAGVPTYGDTFEEYGTGTVATMDKGGEAFNGGFRQF